VCVCVCVQSRTVLPKLVVRSNPTMLVLHRNAIQENVV
jgi:hypothetical protein